MGPRWSEGGAEMGTGRGRGAVKAGLEDIAAGGQELTGGIENSLLGGCARACELDAVKQTKEQAGFDV